MWQPLLLIHYSSSPYRHEIAPDLQLFSSSTFMSIYAMATGVHAELHIANRGQMDQAMTCCLTYDDIHCQSMSFTSYMRCPWSSLCTTCCIRRSHPKQEVWWALLYCMPSALLVSGFCLMSGYVVTRMLAWPVERAREGVTHLFRKVTHLFQPLRADQKEIG